MSDAVATAEPGVADAAGPARREGAPAAFVYVLGSDAPSGRRTYVGWTLDVARRLAEHNAGKGARFTRGRSWTLLHVEALPTREAAMSREWHLKRDRGLRRRLAAAMRAPER